MNTPLKSLILLAVGWIITACAGGGPSAAAEKMGLVAGKNATTQSDTVGKGVAAAAGKTATVAAGITGDVEKGRSLTPETVKPSLDPVWNSILFRAKTLSDVSGTLGDLYGETQGVKAQVGILVASNQALTDIAKAAEKRATDAERQASRNNLLIRNLAFLALFGAVAIGIWMKDIHIALAGAGGAVVTLVVLAVGSYTGRIVDQAASVGGPFLWILAACLVWFALEVLMRWGWSRYHNTGEAFADLLKDAISSPPWKDIQDAIEGLKNNKTLTSTPAPGSNASGAGALGKVMSTPASPVEGVAGV